MDFCVTKGIPHNPALTRSCFDLSSDHSPVLITLNLHALDQAPQPTLCNSKTNWDYFRQLITANLTLHMPLKTEAQIEDAIKYFTDIIQWARWTATRRIPTPHRSMTAQSSSNKSSQNKEDSGKNGTATGHQQAKNYSTGQCKSLNSSYMNTKMPTSKHSYKVLPPQPPLTAPCGTLQKKLSRSRKLLHQFGRHKEHGHEAMLIKHKPSPITLPLYFNLTHRNSTPLPKPPSHHYWKPLSNSNPLSPASNVQRYKQ
jgi:hypothetical protein